jgi:pantoate--beta-alanine ligase
VEVYYTIDALKDKLISLKRLDKTIGLVATMGALHSGHLELIKASQRANDVTVVSIFVNPKQFNNPEDFAKYPKNIENDLELLADVGCDLVFVPSEIEMYPIAPTITLNFGDLEHIMEGKHRPGHFSGVGLIVSKLFSIVQPTNAYFGQKDLQQYHVIKRLVDNLNFEILLQMVPIVRESDGLAKSSRNKRLNAAQRLIAPTLYEGLKAARQMIAKGEGKDDVIKRTKDFFSQIPELELEYFDIVEAQSLNSIDTINHGEPLALCLACYLGDVRLIDNMIIEL